MLESYETESDSCLNNYQDFDKKNYKDEKNYSLSVSYISNENIDRCWFFFSDIILCQTIASNIVVDYKLDKGKNTFKIGNEFSCYWIGISKIHYKCVESQNNFGVRKISWIICLEIGFAIRKTYTIYPITNSDRTLIKLSLELIHPENNEPIKFDETRDYYYKLQSNLISKIANLMDKSNDFLFIHQSFIAKKDLETCWKNMINFELLSSVTSGEIGENFINNDDPEKVGTFWKCYMKKYNKYIYFRVKKVIKNKKRNRWTYCVETFGVNIFIIKQELEISVTKINKESCQISILVKFCENLDKKLYNYKKEKLNEYVKKIKLYINMKEY
jgi:hypothetical protein